MPTKGAAVSVIVPVYNAEKTLVSCIGSVLHQPFEDIEVLAVDDGSTDQSLALLREIAEQDGRVRVFAQDNSGVAAARNLALNHAVGTYVQFVDSDDLLAPDATGRMVEAMRNLAEEIPVNAPLIAFNGALAWDLREGRAAARFPLACEDAKAICRMAEERGLHIQAYPDGGYFYERANEFSRYYEEKLHYPGKALGIKMSEYITTDVNKLLIVAPEEACSQAIPEFQRAFEGKASFFRSRPVYIEIVHPSVNKGRALEALARSLNVPREQVIAFGDEDNDLSMLEYAGVGYAMDNAKPEFKAKADKIAPHFAQDGVAQVIEQLIREGEMDW